MKLHNSLTRAVETFTPTDPSAVTMYVCGPTVYDKPHLGNARPSVVFDMLARLLRHEYGEAALTYARNYTDIDDKIMARAGELGVGISVLTTETITHYEDTMLALGNRMPDRLPRATDYIASMKSMIAELITNGHAYVAEDHVLFDVASWPSHGILSGHKQEDLDAGHRVAVASYKRAPGDFVLWKPSTDDQPGWDSPWGRGRPGWHIECSAMIDDLFGSQTIDIHGGGADLRFPHHECEISQFHACNNVPLARFWMHNALLLVNGEKMAKSSGNFITVEQALERDDGQLIRLALLSTHYRSPLDWTDDLLIKSRQTLANWHRALETVDAAPENNDHSTAILEALRSDLNTPLAIARIHEKMGELASEPEAIAAGVRFATGVMGLDLVDNERYLRGRPDRANIEAILVSRKAARSQRDFVEADRLRDMLTEMGVVIEDGGDGTKWRRA